MINLRVLLKEEGGSIKFGDLDDAVFVDCFFFGIVDVEEERAGGMMSTGNSCSKTM